MSVVDKLDMFTCPLLCDVYMSTLSTFMTSLFIGQFTHKVDRALCPLNLTKLGCPTMPTYTPKSHVRSYDVVSE